jgi:hypothetical protein
MKKVALIMMVAVMLACMLCTVGCGGTVQEPENAIYVTIANGELMTVRQAVSLSDADGDGATTVNDALMLAHDAAYEGGAKAGFSSAKTEYGLSLTCLWGDASGAFGYCVNDASAMSLADAVKVGDHVYAYIYSDQTTWSDAYSYFDVSVSQIKRGEQVTLALSYAGYDANWNAVTAPVANAAITVNGEVSTHTTDVDGKVTLSFDKKGRYVISATSDALTLVPPVCVIDVK